jgi:hypothetical protein
MKNPEVAKGKGPSIRSRMNGPYGGQTAGCRPVVWDALGLCQRRVAVD